MTYINENHFVFFYFDKLANRKKTKITTRKKISNEARKLQTVALKS